MARWSWFALAAMLAAGCAGHHEDPGTPSKDRPPKAALTERADQEIAAAASIPPVRRARHPATRRRAAPKQILFGDLHVHTTFSADAFLRSLPLMQGEGAHPPADACDFARFCSQLDFWAITDHAESISPRHWQETKEAIRQCNAVAGDPENPDLVSFLGWEWTQVGVTAADHYGHKNVILRETAEDRVPRRPISALDERLIGAMRRRAPLTQRLMVPLLEWPRRQRYFDFGVFIQELADVPMCPEGVDTRKLPDDCHEAVHTPQALFEKLAQWGVEAIVIPHGNTWGLYTPLGSSWDKQLVGPQHDPQRQTLIEVFSGHGNSEEYRSWHEIEHDAAKMPVCPAPTRSYLPCCWQAGEIVRGRCGDAPDQVCERRVRAAQINFLNAGVAGRATLPGTPVEDWKDCGQCRDCFAASFNYVPRSSTQYALAISNFDAPGPPRRFRFGFIASSDNHSARPGTGYKEFSRRQMTEATGPRDSKWSERLFGVPPAPSLESVRVNVDLGSDEVRPLQIADFERQASFFMTGGLVAVHAEGRDRDAIWRALGRREVYGTSGERILLWFDLLNAPGGMRPMGSEVRLRGAPTFRVRAVGSFAQKPGCPDWSRQSLGHDAIEHLCRGECYNPSDERRVITRIEVVRIRPQVRRDEPVDRLIEDPWRRIACPGTPAGCEVEFTDPEQAGGREIIYYVRAIQEPTPAVNAAALRCTWDANGDCVAVHPCYGDYRTPFDDDCLAPNEERAWSSPIYVTREP